MNVEHTIPENFDEFIKTMSTPEEIQKTIDEFQQEYKDLFCIGINVPNFFEKPIDNLYVLINLYLLAVSNAKLVILGCNPNAGDVIIHYLEKNLIEVKARILALEIKNKKKA